MMILEEEQAGAADIKRTRRVPHDYLNSFPVLIWDLEAQKGWDNNSNKNQNLRNFKETKKVNTTP